MSDESYRTEWSFVHSHSRVKRILYTNGTTYDYSVTPSGSPIKRTNYADKGRNPNWRDDIRRNRQAATPLYAEKWEYQEESHGHCHVVYNNPTSVSGYYYEGARVTPVPTTVGASTWYTDAVGTAKTRFLNKALSAQRAIEGMTVLGEIGETLRMLRNPARALRRGIDDFVNDARKRHRRRPGQSRRDQLRNLQDSWLEYAFGWTPFINDVNSAGQAINRWNDWDLPKVTFSASGEGSLQASKLIGNSTDNLVKIKRVSTQERYGSCIYRGATRAMVLNPVRYQTRLLGFSWNDFLPTVWELIPYSFLVDYFTNIGDIINAWSHGSANLAWYTQTTKSVYTSKIVESYTASQSNYTVVSTTPSVQSGSRTITVRDPQSGSLIPDLAFQIPGMGTKWINIAALAKMRRL